MLGAPWEILGKNSKVEAVVWSEGRNLPGGHLCKSARESAFLSPPGRVSAAYLSLLNSDNEGTESPGSMFLYKFVFFNFGGAGSSLLLVGFLLVAVSEGCSLVVAPATLILAASLVGEHMLCGGWAAALVVPGLESTGSVVVAHGPRGSVAPWHVGSSWTRDRTPDSCTGSRTLYH